MILKKRYIAILLILFIVQLQAGAFQQEIAKNNLEQARTAMKCGDYLKAIRLSREASNVSDEKDLKAEALYVQGRAAEAIAKSLISIASRQVKPRANGGYWDEDFIHWPGLKPYQDKGLRFEWDHSGSLYIYDGASYRDIISKYPESKWACAASFKLLRLEKIRGGEWGGNIQPAEEEIKKLETFLEQCPQPEVKSEIRLAMALDYIYLISCHEYRSSPDFDPEKAALYILKTEELLKNIKTEHLNADESKKVKYLPNRLKDYREILKNGGVAKRKSD
jgi:hypothetical protein